MNDTEKRITRALVAHLAASGFVPAYIDDPEAEAEDANVTTADEIIRYTEEVDLLTYPVVFRRKRDGKRHWLVLIPGNDEDILSDWGVGRDTEHWDDALEAFDGAAVLEAS